MDPPLAFGLSCPLVFNIEDILAWEDEGVASLALTITSLRSMIVSHIHGPRGKKAWSEAPKAPRPEIPKHQMSPEGMNAFRLSIHRRWRSQLTSSRLDVICPYCSPSSPLALTSSSHCYEKLGSNVPFHCDLVGGWR